MQVAFPGPDLLVVIVLITMNDLDDLMAIVFF